MKWLLVLLSALLSLAGTIVVSAQQSEPPAMLIVTLRDASGRGIPGMQVIVRDRSGHVDFGRTTTDTHGQALFPTLPAADVRVAIVGQIPNGPVLRQEGNDASGLPMTLSLPPNRLDLRMEPDGAVIPDPTTMIALENGGSGDGALSPTAPALPTIGGMPTPPPIKTDLPSAPFVGTDGSAIWIGCALALFLAGALASVLMLVARWRRER